MLHVEGRQGTGVLVLVKEGTMVVVVGDVVVVVEGTGVVVGVGIVVEVVEGDVGVIRS